MTMWTRLLFVMAGGAIGSALRYQAACWMHRLMNTTFPVGTLFVNVVGSFAIGLLWSLFEQSNLSPNWRLFFFTGLMGGFTTFSSFSLETLHLLRTRDYGWALTNIMSSQVLGLLAVVIGFGLGRYFIKQMG